MSLFCRHNRFVADCPICSKGTVLDSSTPARRTSRSGDKRQAKPREKPAFTGPHAASPGYEDPEGRRYVVRLERVPGGVRLAEWSGSELRRRAPVLPPEALVDLLDHAGVALTPPDAAALADAVRASAAEEPDGSAGVSRGRSGDFKEELRVEPLDGGDVRVGRWVLRPNRGWELQEAPPMLPAKRYAEAVAAAVRSGALEAAPVSA
ncbi:MAG: hypothetical protein ACR2HC_01320 [Thermoleophilaceae bacterium]